jgi:endonuclease YncB( thermonuclease family)
MRRGGSFGRRRRAPGLGQWLGNARPFVLAAVLAWLWGTNTGVVTPIGFMATQPERIVAHFGRCGRSIDTACVVDGDTFRLGERRIRIIGIDAPETHPSRCAEEARLGEAATVRLQALLNAGPFEMVGSRADLTDRYGRELRTILRDGQSIGDQLREEGHVRRYLGYRMPWCS